MDLEALKTTRARVVGIRQTLKAVERGEAVKVFLARDAEESVTRDLRRLCAEKGLPVEEVDSMAALGKACGIEVGAAAAALLLKKD